jgi:DNA-binding transcriptional ArsR family regulator
MLDSLFKALSDPTRRKILKMLRRGDMTAGEIAEHFNISKPSMSHHLNVLKQAELVLDERKGQYIYYSLNTTVFQDVLTWFADLMNNKGKGDDNEKRE